LLRAAGNYVAWGLGDQAAAAVTKRVKRAREAGSVS
jgi:hypothetical protein